MDLTAKVGSVDLRTPLILASGQITESPSFFVEARRYGCSAMVTRSLRETIPEGRERIPSPRYHVFDGSSMMNCEWVNENSWTKWADDWAQTVIDTGDPLIISVSARDIEGCSNIVTVFTESSLASAFEVNVSCAHSGALHGNLNTNIDHLVDVVRRIRPSTSLPLWIKLSYSPIICEMARAAEEEGADAIVCTNTIGPGLAIDTETTKFKLGIQGGAGGVSGPAIFPVALWCVYQISQTIKIPVVGSGGINDADKAIQMLMAGASALQLYTAPALAGPTVFGEILDGITDFIKDHHQFDKVSGIVGASLKWANNETRFEQSIPVFEEQLCTNCGKCLKACVFGGIVPGDTASIGPNCIGCNACVGVCPSGAITARY